MKKILLALLCFITVCLANAQSRFGAISYTLPEGWVARQAGEDIEIVKKGDENSGCKITLFKQQTAVVTTGKQFSALWASKIKNNNALQKTTTPVIIAEDGWISISASATNGASSYTEGFYTLCDSSITAVILTQAQGTVCAKEIKSILATFSIPVTVINPKTRAKTKKTKFPYVYR